MTETHDVLQGEGLVSCLQLWQDSSRAVEETEAEKLAATLKWSHACETRRMAVKCIEKELGGRSATFRGKVYRVELGEVIVTDAVVIQEHE